MNLIGLTGAKGCGKSTVAHYLKRCDPSFRVMSMAEPIRDMLEAINLSPEELYDGKDDIIPRFERTGRRMLQTLGTDWGRDMIGEDIWVNVMKDRIRNSPWDGIIIDDIRFPNEGKMIKEMGGQLIYIKRPCVENGIDTHSSEAHYMDLKHDKVLINDGTEKDFLASLDGLKI